MRNPLAPRFDEHPWDRVMFGFAIAIGSVLILFAGGEFYRGWFAGAAFVMAVLFVAIYSRRPWRTTYAGRATMLAMQVTTVYTLQSTVVLFWKYPHWEIVQTFVYLAIFIAASYKLRALTRREPVHDPTTDHVDPVGVAD